MKTSITNRIRSLLDAMPPSIRNARWFMWPFFFVWFKGRHVREAMEFKRLAPKMSDAELRELYARTSTWADSRPTDTNPEAMQYVLEKIDGDARSLLDVGSGRGFFLQHVQVPMKIGCDLLGRPHVIAMAERLPFKDASFDVVHCAHTLEHMRDLHAAFAELKRVARRQVIVVVPRQRYFDFTMDLHLQFFEQPEDLQRLTGGEVRQFGSDLVSILRGVAGAPVSAQKPQ
jgi:SAM-dependent methyltransferase